MEPCIQKSHQHPTDADKGQTGTTSILTRNFNYRGRNGKPNSEWMFMFFVECQKR